MTPATAATSRWNRQARRQREIEALDSHQWSAAPPLTLPAGIELQWLGTSGFRLTAAGTTMLIDPYATRPSLKSVIARRQPLHSSAGLVDAVLPRADAVLVGHAHFDHALDVPTVSRRDGAPVYGSRSVATLLGLHGLGSSAREVEPYRRYEIGPFVVSFIPSRHSRLVAGLRVPSDGELTCDHLEGLIGKEYRCGQVYGIHIEVDGFSLYHQGSADLLDDERIPAGADVFLCGIAGRMFSPGYLRRILPRLDPQVVVPHHWDNFFRPLTSSLGFSLNVRLHRFPGEVAAVSRDIAVHTLRPLQTVS